jgi:outer membrane biosynthesis protein TonB
MLERERGVRQMVEAITATYVQQDADWAITVSGQGKELTARAPGIIAARDRADQLVEQLSDGGRTTVVHLINGSALDFTSAYMTARLTLPKLPPLEVPPPGSVPKQQTTETVVEKKPAEKKPLPTGKQLPQAVEEPKPVAEPAPEVETKTPAKPARA